MHYSAIFIFALFLIVLILNIREDILVEYNRLRRDDSIDLSISALWGIIKFKYEIPLVDLSKDGLRFIRIRKEGRKEKEVQKEKKVASFKSVYQKLKDAKCFYNTNKRFIRDIICYIKRRVVIKDFNLKVKFGTDDAFYTGILSGILWSASGIITSYLCSNMRVLKKKVDIQSNFMEKELTVDFYCIFSIKIVHIIVVKIKLFLYSKKNRKCKKSKAEIKKNSVKY